MRKISEKTVYDGKWLSVHESVYENQDGRTITWENIRRKRCTSGVVVVARLLPSNRFILIKQFRPAVNGYVLGFPAGLAFDDPAHALVELEEETGYVGKIVSVSPLLKTGSTISDENGRIVCIEVDENDPANQNPQQQLELGEVILVCPVSPDEVMDFLKEEQAQGTHVASNLWYFFGLRNLL